MFLVPKKCFNKSSLAFKEKAKPFVVGRINAGYAMIKSWEEMGEGIFIHPGLILLLRMPVCPK